MDSLIGLPAVWFADEECLGCRVRLIERVEISGGGALWKGECFVVAGIEPGDLHERRFFLTNYRAIHVPVNPKNCELLLEWPANVRGNHLGGK